MHMQIGYADDYFRCVSCDTHDLNPVLIFGSFLSRFKYIYLSRNFHINTSTVKLSQKLCWWSCNLAVLNYQIMQSLLSSHRKDVKCNEFPNRANTTICNNHFCNFMEYQWQYCGCQQAQHDRTWTIQASKKRSKENYKLNHSITNLLSFLTAVSYHLHLLFNK